MRKDDHLIFEALTSAQQEKELVKYSLEKQKEKAHPQGCGCESCKSENAESKFTQTKGIETYAVNQLEKMIKELENISTAVHLSKSSHLDQLLSKVRDTAEMLMTERGSGTSENAEEDIDDSEEGYNKGEEEHYKNKEENAEGNLSYSPEEHLVKAAHAIRDILLTNADDEARTEHIIQMAHIILGSKGSHDPREYNKMLDGLILVLNRFIKTEMN